MKKQRFQRTVVPVSQENKPSSFTTSGAKPPRGPPRSWLIITITPKMIQLCVYDTSHSEQGIGGDFIARRHISVSRWLIVAAHSLDFLSRICILDYQKSQATRYPKFKMHINYVLKRQGEYAIQSSQKPLLQHYGCIDGRCNDWRDCCVMYSPFETYDTT